MKKGFSLIELLISLIIISLIISSFIPIITKKIKRQNLSISFSKPLEKDCSKFDPNGRCLMCEDDSCILCTTSGLINQGEFVDPKLSCDIKKCTGFDLNCVSCDKNGCLSCKKGFNLTQDKKCIENWIYPSSENCAKVSSIYVDAEHNAGKAACVAKRNFGDSSMLSIPSKAGVTVRMNDYQECNTAKCCWLSIRTASTCSLPEGYDYSPCNRTLCSWDAAVAICSNFHYGNGITNDSWRLPTTAEMSGWDYFSKELKKNGLQFCFSPGYNLPQEPVCESRCEQNKGCVGSGSYHTHCHPVGLWANSALSGTTYRYYNVPGGDESGNINGANYPYAVRCVLEKFKIEE